MTALRRNPMSVRRNALSVGAMPVVAGVLLGALAVAYELRPKTLTELVIAGVALALVCVTVRNPQRFLLGAVVLDIPLEWGKDLFLNANVANVARSEAGLQISITTFALATLYALWAFQPRRQGESRPAYLRPALPLIAFVGINALSVLVATDKGLALNAIAVLSQSLLLFIYVVSNVRTRSDLNFLVTVILIGLVVESVLMLFLYATGSQAQLLGLGNRADSTIYGSRVGGTVGSPNAAAAYLCLPLSLAVAVLASPASKRQRQLALFTIPLGIIALILTGSRGGWIAFAIAIAILAIWAVSRRLLDARTVLVVAVATAALLAPFAGAIAQRALGNDNGSAASRITMAKLASDMISAHPLLGVGVNNTEVVIPNYAGPQYAGQFIATIHDKYLLVSSEAGIGALVALLWFLAATVGRGWRCARLRDPALAAVAAGVTAGIAGQLFHMAVDTFESRPQDEGLWLMAALLVVIELIVRRERTTGVRW